MSFVTSSVCVVSPVYQVYVVLLGSNTLYLYAYRHMHLCYMLKQQIFLFCHCPDYVPFCRAGEGELAGLLLPQFFFCL